MTIAPVLGVFVPGALAGGLLVSLALVIGDLFARVRRDRGARRAADITAAAAAADIRDGHGADRTSLTGVRSPRAYQVTAAIAASLVALTLPGATWNFLNPGGYISDIGWIWAVSLLAALAVAVVGVAALRLVPSFAPVLVVAIGLGAMARFVAGPEDFSGPAVIAVGVSVTIAVGVAAWRWSRRATLEVPPWTRPLLRSTPLGRAPN